MTRTRHRPFTCLARRIDRQRATRLAREAFVVALAAVVMLSMDQTLAGAAIVTKINTFCATWIKPIYLGVLAFVVLKGCYQGFVALLVDEGHGGRTIGVALIGGSAGVGVPAAILAAVATGSAFAC